MKKLLIIFTSLLLVSCSTVKYIPTHEEVIVHHVDSIAWHDSTVVHHIYNEHYKEYVGPKDTLNLETTYSEFKAWNDSTSNTLRGEAKNKKDSIPIKIKWKEKIVYRDSLIIKEILVPVEIPKEVRYTSNFCKITITWFILSILYIGIKIYLKFKR